MMTWIRSVSGRIGCVRIGRQEVGPMPLDIPHPIWRDLLIAANSLLETHFRVDAKRLTLGHRVEGGQWARSIRYFRLSQLLAS
jgi:hypothetical protein